MNTHRFILPVSFLDRIPRLGLLAVLTMLALGLVVGPTAYAQQSPTSAQETEQQMAATLMPDGWRTNFGEQATDLLRSRVEATRSMMLQNLVHFAASETHDLDLSGAAPALLDIYAQSPSEAHRIMAATALAGIARHDDTVAPMMKTLSELLEDERSPRVREHTLNVLLDYASHRGERLVLSHELYAEFKRLKRSG